jgi:antitoxin ChpS
MHITSLRKVGGSIMLAVPPAVLDLLHLKAGARVGLQIEKGRLIVEPQERPHYTLEELLAQCDASAEHTAEDREWLDASPVGSELIWWNAVISTSFRSILPRATSNGVPVRS